MKVYLCYATMVFNCFCTLSSSFSAFVSQHGPVSLHSHCCHSISLRQCLSSFLGVEYFSGLEIMRLQFLCPVHDFYVFVGGLFIYFSVSLLLKSSVNICWRVLDLQVGGACVVDALNLFLFVVKGRCQFVMLEIYWLLHWFFHTILSC